MKEWYSVVALGKNGKRIGSEVGGLTLHQAVNEASKKLNKCPGCEVHILNAKQNSVHVFGFGHK